MEDNKKRRKHRKLNQKTKKGIRRFLLIVSACVFIFSAYKLVTIYLDYQKVDKEFSDIRNEYTKNKGRKDGDYLMLDWEELLKKNEDVIGWIEVPNTSINYPLLKGRTNDTYLRTNIDKEYSIAGSIFADANTTNPFIDLNTILYGHNMKNGSMFADLIKYKDEKYANEHRYIFLYLSDGTVSKYNLVSVHYIDAYSELFQPNVNDVNKFYEQIAEGNLLNGEYVKDGITPLIMLSTCATYDTDDSSRIVLHAILEKGGIDPKNEKMY